MKFESTVNNIMAAVVDKVKTSASIRCHGQQLMEWFD